VQTRVGFEQPVPPCGITPPLTPQMIGSWRGRAGGPSRLLIVAADAPLSRERLEAALALSDFPRLALSRLELQTALGTLVRESGGERAAATEVVLRL
jgi:hypothetical protein